MAEKLCAGTEHDIQKTTSLDCLMQKEYNYGNEEQNGKDSLGSRYDGCRQRRWSVRLTSKQLAEKHAIERRKEEM